MCPFLFDVTGCDVALRTHKTEYKGEMAIANAITIKLRRTKFGRGRVLSKPGLPETISEK